MINELFNKIGTDGQQHIIVSAVATTLIALVLPVWIAAAIVLLVGVGKELFWDMALRRGTPEWKDLACDVAGIIIGVI